MSPSQNDKQGRASEEPGGDAGGRGDAGRAGRSAGARRRGGRARRRRRRGGRRGRRGGADRRPPSAAAEEAEELAEKAEEAAEAAAEAPSPSAPARPARPSRPPTRPRRPPTRPRSPPRRSRGRAAAAAARPSEPKAGPGRAEGLRPGQVRAHVRPQGAARVRPHPRQGRHRGARDPRVHPARRGRRPGCKLLESAVANAEHNHELVGEELRILNVHADEGPTLKRYRPRAMGRATRIRKRTSHLSITLTPKES